MKEHETIPVQIASGRGQTSSGTVERQIWDKKERTIRGLKALGIFWAIAIFSVILPLLHFILVPLFILTGPVAFFWIAGQEEVILGGKGLCPECKKEFEIARSSVKWPISDLCNHCQSELKISKQT